MPLNMHEMLSHSYDDHYAVGLFCPGQSGFLEVVILCIAEPNISYLGADFSGRILILQSVFSDSL